MPPSSTESAAMVAEPGDTGIQQILAKTLNGNTITLDIKDIDTVKEVKQKIKEKRTIARRPTSTYIQWKEYG